MMGSEGISFVGISRVSYSEFPSNRFDFQDRLPEPQSDMATSILKDPYIFDFLSVGKEAHERDIERELVRHITEFLLELGSGFAYVGK